MKKNTVQSAQLKINLTLYGTFFCNSLYALFTLALGIWYKSSWYLSIAVYYISLATMKFSLLYYSRSNTAGSNLYSELKKFRFCGIFLLIMNTALSGLAFYKTVQNRELRHNGATTTTLALFTLLLFALSIINVIKYRKFKSPLLFAAKLISFASALVSMLSLESAIIGKLSDAISDTSQKTITGISVFTVLAIITYIGIFMIVKANKSLKNLNQASKNTEVTK